MYTRLGGTLPTIILWNCPIPIRQWKNRHTREVGRWWVNSAAHGFKTWWVVEALLSDRLSQWWKRRWHTYVTTLATTQFCYRINSKREHRVALSAISRDFQYFLFHQPFSLIPVVRFVRKRVFSHRIRIGLQCLAETILAYR